MQLSPDTSRNLLKAFTLGLRGLVFEIAGIIYFPRFFKKFNPDAVKSILIVADYRIGDSALATPMVAALGSRWPQASITAFVNKVSAGIWRLMPEISDVITIDTSSFFIRRLASGRKLAGRRFDLIIDATCDRTLLGVLLSFYARGGYRIGYDIAGRGFLFNRPLFRRARARHVVDEIANLASAAGAGVSERRPALAVPASAASEADGVLDMLLKRAGHTTDGVPLIGVHAGATYITQHWLPGRFAQAADRLAERYGAVAVLFGQGDAELRLNEGICSAMKSRPILFVNRPLALTVAALARCRMLLCNNSGLLHVAGAINVPTVSSMGPTLAHRFKPVGPSQVYIRKNIPCIGCNNGRCRIGTHDCMTQITVEEVVEAAIALLDRK